MILALGYESSIGSMDISYSDIGESWKFSEEIFNVNWRKCNVIHRGGKCDNNCHLQ